MSKVSLRPSGLRDWSMVGLGAALALLVTSLLWTRYEVIPTRTYNNFLQVDRWTGTVASCFNTHCRAVDYNNPPVADPL